MITAINFTNQKRSNGMEVTCAAVKKERARVSLLHSEEYARLLQDGMGYIHHDRDRLLHSLLDYSGFLRNTPRFFTVVQPQKASRKHLERFHSPDYLDLLQFPMVHDATHSASETNQQLQILDAYGLVEDCPLPKEKPKHERFWEYCRYMAGASIQAATLLTNNDCDVAINWGGGRHHAHHNQAGGFCYINDVVLAIQCLIRCSKRVLYLDIDIHHADGVQSAFYDTDQVMTVSFHRHAPGFFPSASGSAQEKGKYDTKGMGFNLNVILPKLCSDDDLIPLFQETLASISNSFAPDVIVLCVGADGIRNDPLVGQADGWSLSPEGLAECVRLSAQSCHASKDDCKLLVVGGGGYNPSETARTFLLCTAAACEGARPGMLWDELPKDIPPHEHFPRYGPEFRLVGDKPSYRGVANKSNGTVPSCLLGEVHKAVQLTALYISAYREKENKAFTFVDEVEIQIPMRKKSKCSSRRRRRVRLNKDEESDRPEEALSDNMIVKQS